MSKTEIKLKGTHMLATQTIIGLGYFAAVVMALYFCIPVTRSQVY